MPSSPIATSSLRQRSLIVSMATPQAPHAGESRSIDTRTTVGTVHLTVRDLDRSRTFYERALGLVATESEDGTIALGTGVSGAPPLVTLRGDASAPARERRATGLFHMAILMPSRRDLAVALARLVQARWPLDGASDHLVSEALYLSDPDGNGIEIYRDRPRDEWPRRDGALEMATLPLDLDGLVSELDSVSELSATVPAGTTMGHVHLQVGDLAATERFYNGVLGFDVVVRTYPGALFVSAGGYHHHLGLNVWNSRGGARPTDGAIGLRHYEVWLPDAASLEIVLGRIADAGLPVSSVDGGSLVRDPAGIGVLLRVAG
jgi:catechol 2,3-dioxygenase